MDFSFINKVGWDEHTRDNFYQAGRPVRSGTQALLEHQVVPANQILPKNDTAPGPPPFLVR